MTVVPALDSSDAGSQMSQTNYFLYVGVYGEGIYAYHYRTTDAELEGIGLVGEVVNPSFIATDRDFRFLYAVSELEGNVDGGVAAFAIDRASGALKKLNSLSSAGQAPCHLSVDHSTKILLVANYATGSVSVFPLEQDGHLGEMSALMTAHGSSVNPERQEGPHAHEAIISADNRFVYVPDLGLDHIRIYQLDPANAKLVPNDPAFVKVEAGAGPRHIALSSNGRFAYVVNELKPLVTTFKRDPANGSLKQIQSIAAVPQDSGAENGQAGIEIHPERKFLYVSNRGPGTLMTFAINPDDGTLKQIQVAQTGGTWPRGFRIDPTGRLLIVGDQKANRFVIFDIDRTNGRLSLTARAFQVPSPVDFLFVPAQ